jgi:hypothetical protein
MKNFILNGAIAVIPTWIIVVALGLHFDWKMIAILVIFSMASRTADIMFPVTKGDYAMRDRFRARNT